jgi:hypothetical protein
MGFMKVINEVVLRMIEPAGGPPTNHLPSNEDSEQIITYRLVQFQEVVLDHLQSVGR